MRAWGPLVLGVMWEETIGGAGSHDYRTNSQPGLRPLPISQPLPSMKSRRMPAFPSAPPPSQAFPIPTLAPVSPRNPSLLETHPPLMLLTWGPPWMHFYSLSPKKAVCVCVRARVHTRVHSPKIGALSPSTLCPPSPGSQPSSPATPSQIGFNRQKLGICPWNSILSLGPWGGTWVPIRVFVSLWMPGSNFQPFPAAWRMDPGNQRDTTSPPTSSGQGPPMAPHLPLLNLSAAAWLLCPPCRCPGPSPSCTTNHSVTLDLSG